jgi:hypothetical protein
VTGPQAAAPIPRFLIEPLAAHLDGKSREELVFTAPGGGVLRNNAFRRRAFDAGAAAAGLAGLTPHELMHTAASLAVVAGANVKAIQRILGHAAAAMTLDACAGLFSDDPDAWPTRSTMQRRGLLRTQCGLLGLRLRSVPVGE